MAATAAARRPTDRAKAALPVRLLILAPPSPHAGGDFARHSRRGCRNGCYILSSSHSRVKRSFTQIQPRQAPLVTSSHMVQDKGRSFRNLT
jgi:hypothetical protein